MILRGCLFGALGVVVGLGLVCDAGDIGARHLATSKVEERIRQVVPQAAGVHGRIRAFPFLTIGINGRVHDISARIDRLTVAPVVFTDLVVDLHGARVSIGNMVTSLRLDVTRIQQGTVTFAISESALERADPGVSPAERRVSVDAAHRVLLLARASGLPVTVALPPRSLVPCVPGVAPGPDGLLLGCSFTAVPSAFTATAATSGTTGDTTTTTPTTTPTTTGVATTVG